MTGKMCSKDIAIPFPGGGAKAIYRPGQEETARA